MKKMKLIIIISLVSMFAPAYSQEKDKEVMIRKIFSVIQQKDADGFVKLFPDASTMREVVTKLYSEEKKEGLDELLAELSDSSLQSQFSETFSEIMEKGNEKGIDWSQAKFISFSADSSIIEEIKTTRLTGKIYFNAGKIEYFMSYDDIIWFENRGWYGVNIRRIDEKSKEDEPDYSDRDLDDDSTMMTVDSAKVMMDTASKVIIEEKSTIKSMPIKPEEKKKPAKTKSQSPARKPE
jgi:hypothetical protein